MTIINNITNETIKLGKKVSSYYNIKLSALFDFLLISIVNFITISCVTIIHISKYNLINPGKMFLRILQADDITLGDVLD
ncbi:hypothetical protein V1478_002178 [Vespula squamosa]|uniref:Uncharacterized protein n=1 Tax=Vespula squamosa TaxID=30214 RepID=A0ABD2BW96_VESSQ